MGTGCIGLAAGQTGDGDDRRDAWWGMDMCVRCVYQGRGPELPVGHCPSSPQLLLEKTDHGGGSGTRSPISHPSQAVKDVVLPRSDLVRFISANSGPTRGAP